MRILKMNENITLRVYQTRANLIAAWSGKLNPTTVPPRIEENTFQFHGMEAMDIIHRTEGWVLMHRLPSWCK